MLAKLTLTIDKQVVEKAKSYAQRRQRSVSRLVEEYLMTISAGNSVSPEIKVPRADITDKITGMFANEYNGQDYKSLLEDALIEKNL